MATYLTPTSCDNGYKIEADIGYSLVLDTGNPIIGEKISNITFSLGQDGGSPSGNFYVKIYSGSTEKGSWTFDSSTVASSYSSFSCPLSGNTYEMLEGDHISIVGDLDDTSYFRVQRTTNATLCDYATLKSGDVAPWTNFGSETRCFCSASITYSGDTPGGDTLLPPPVAWVNV